MSTMHHFFWTTHQKHVRTGLFKLLHWTVYLVKQMSRPVDFSCDWSHITRDWWIGFLLFIQVTDTVQLRGKCS